MRLENKNVIKRLTRNEGLLKIGSSANLCASVPPGKNNQPRQILDHQRIETRNPHTEPPETRRTLMEGKL